jgi:hypothetical protein
VRPHVEERRPPVDRHARRAGTAAPHPQRQVRTAPGRQPNEPSIPERRPPPPGDRGLILLAVFTASALLIVALVVLVGAVESWWILIPVMTADFAVTAAVLVTVARLIEDADS